MKWSVYHRLSICLTIYDMLSEVKRIQSHFSGAQDSCKIY